MAGGARGRRTLGPARETVVRTGVVLRPWSGLCCGSEDGLESGWEQGGAVEGALDELYEVLPELRPAREVGPG